MSREVDKPYNSIKWFEENRPEIYEFVCNQERDPHNIISTPVKAGKRIMMEIESLRAQSKPAGEKHIVLSNFNATDCDDQKIELENYGATCIFGAKRLKKEKPRIYKELMNGDIPLVFHIDESDYGTGCNQVFDELFGDIKSLAYRNKNIKTRLYSATNHEAIFSDFSDISELKEFEPPSHFRGPGYFLDQGNVFEATPPWDINHQDFTPQGWEFISHLLEGDPNERNFGLLRLAVTKKEYLKFNDIKNPEHPFRKKLRKLGIVPKIVDKDHKFDWGKPNGERDWEILAPGYYLIIVNQTCTRSTDIGFRPAIRVWHDYREKGTNYTTCSQAMERLNHYDYDDGYWDKPVDTKIYCCRSTYLYSANRITRSEFLENTGRKISSRVSTHIKLSTSRDHYDYIITEGDKEAHKEKVKEKFDITPQMNFSKDKNGYFLTTFKGKNTVWNEKDVFERLFTGLHANFKSSRTRAYYKKNDDTPMFITIVHDGTRDATSNTKKSMYNHNN